MSSEERTLLFIDYSCKYQKWVMEAKHRKGKNEALGEAKVWNGSSFIGRVAFLTLFTWSSAIEAEVRQIQLLLKGIQTH